MYISFIAAWRVSISLQAHFKLKFNQEIERHNKILGIKYTNMRKVIPETRLSSSRTRIEKYLI